MHTIQGSETFGVYTASDREIDVYTWNHPEFLSIVAGGNSGTFERGSDYTIGSPALSKNTIAVGAAFKAQDSALSGAGDNEYVQADVRMLLNLYQYTWAYDPDYSYLPKVGQAATYHLTGSYVHNPSAGTIANDAWFEYFIAGAPAVDSGSCNAGSVIPTAPSTVVSGDKKMAVAYSECLPPRPPPTE